MQLHELYPFPEERKTRKRLGRGRGSGLGKTSGKGHKGQNARSGGGVPAGFEGGQMPLQRRLPKHGFKNPFRTVYEVVNLDDLARVFPEGGEIGLDELYGKGLCRKNKPVKVRSCGDAPKGLKVQAHRFSKQAKAKIEEAGGEARSIEPVQQDSKEG